jgi:hypothetical protein
VITITLIMLHPLHPASYRKREPQESNMMRSALYPLICMAISAIVLTQLVSAMGAVMQRGAAIPAMIVQPLGK